MLTFVGRSPTSFSTKLNQALQPCKKIVYESCGKWLARALRDQRQASYIPYIKGTDGRRISPPKDIAHAFGEFYSSLYNLPPSSPSSPIEQYLSSARLPCLPCPIRGELEVPITVEELSGALKSAKQGKAPGPGFTIQYYKTLLPQLGPHMVTAFNGLPRSHRHHS